MASDEQGRREWRVTSYMPSQKHFSLSEDFTPEQITALVGEPKRGSPDGKCDFQWEFFASAYFDGADGAPVEMTLPCAIWDYKGARWSAYGPAQVFRQLGLLPAAEQVSV